MMLTGNLLAKVLASASDNCDCDLSDEEMGLGLALAEVLLEASEMAQTYGDQPVDIDITIGLSEQRTAERSGG